MANTPFFHKGGIYMLDIVELTGGRITTEAVQRAIDRASGEKRVLYFPAGEYSVASLTLRDNSALYLAKDAVIKAATEEDAWKSCPTRPLLRCDGAENVSIRGEGTIDGMGAFFADEKGERKKTPYRMERLIWLRNAKNVLIEGVRLVESVGWTLHIDLCENVLIDGVIIRNPTWRKRHNGDGIDINSSENVTIMNCDIVTGDDAICLKSIDYTEGKDHRDTPRPVMENIFVYNCCLATTCNACKIGTETVGDIRDVHFEKIFVMKHPDIERESPDARPIGDFGPLSAMAVESNDGGKVTDISFKDFFIEDCDSPLFVLLQRRKSYVKDPPEGSIKNVTAENIICKRAHRASLVLAQEDMKIGKVTLRESVFSSVEEPHESYDPRRPTGREYPDPYNFGTFPAFGLYARGAEVEMGEDIVFTNKNAAGRPAVDIQK